MPFNDPLAALMTPPVGRSRRISSNEQPNWNDGNFDMTRLAPLESFELPILNGPGILHHVWMTSHAGGMGELDAMTLRIYWDGRKEPAVEVPLGEFFAIGQGRPAAVESFPVQVSPTGSLTCYWRMPFRESARIVVTNDNPFRSSGLYWQVDWIELPDLPPDTAYFHARYRQEYPAAPGQDYLIADIEGCGKYVGTVMSVTLAQDGWFGEGDDFFYIDGESVPSLQGTGSEDYFNDAWGFRQRTSTWFGQPRWEGWQAGHEGIAYRWHVLDPVHFTKSLRVTMEHKGNREIPEEAWYLERPDYFNSVAFWYQTGEPKPFGELPPWPQRRVPWERIPLAARIRSTRVERATLPEVTTTGFFGGRPALHWVVPNAEAHLKVPFEVDVSGRYAVRLVAFTDPGGAVCRITVDGEQLWTIHSLRSAEPDERDLRLGVIELETGEHLLEICTLDPGRVVLDALRILHLPPEASRDVKTENEAHFIRMGIGRALYAYRMAFGELPHSLEQMVAIDLMDSRYLRDENGTPVNGRLEDGRFVVEASAWYHSWQGLDARR